MPNAEGRMTVDGEGPATSRSHSALGFHSAARTRAAFSMIELLLVVAISLIAAGIAVPLFVRSFHSSQLRTSARVVVQAAKYARSMAVLQQKQMAVLFDRVKGEIEVVSLSGRQAMGDRNAFLDVRSTRATDQLLAGTDEEKKDQGPSDIQSELVRPLGADVKIEGFSSDRADQVIDGIYWVNYYPNGMSDGFEVRIADKEGKIATVKVDAISGSAQVEFQ